MQGLQGQGLQGLGLQGSLRALQGPLQGLGLQGPGAGAAGPGGCRAWGHIFGPLNLENGGGVTVKVHRGSLHCDRLHASLQHETSDPPHDVACRGAAEATFYTSDMDADYPQKKNRKSRAT